MANAGTETNTLGLLQPEILSKDELIDLIRQRNLKMEKIEDLDKSTLVDLYYKNVIPMPQRKYRLNRRGREMAKKQIIMAKRKRTHDESVGNNQDSSQSTNDSRFLCSFNTAGTGGDRLKPPPSAINQQRKVIKLGKSASSNLQSNGEKQKPALSKTGLVRLNPSTNSLDNIEIKTFVPKTDNKPTNGSSEKADVTETSTVTENKIVTVKKTSTGVTMTKIIPSKHTTETSESKPRKVKLNRKSFSSSGVAMETATSPTYTTSTTYKATSPTSIPTSPISLSPDEDTLATRDSNEKQLKTSPTSEDGVVTKKFKKITVTWP